MEEQNHKTEPKVSIIVATYNRYVELWAVLDSIEKQSTNVLVESVVVDQSEDYHEQAQKLKKAGVKYFHSKYKGLSKARNLGIEKATGEYVCLVDDDAILHPEYLEKVVSFLDKKPEYSVLCGIIENMDDGKPFSRHMKLKPLEVGAYSIDVCMSSAITFRKEAVSETGGFDENFGVGSKFGGSEETDILVRIVWSGQKIYYLPDAVVRHPKFEHKAMEPGSLRRKTYNYGMGRGALCRKHLSENPIWSTYMLVKALIVPVGGVLISIVTFDLHGCCRFLGSLTGRLKGFVSYYRIVGSVTM